MIDHIRSAAVFVIIPVAVAAMLSGCGRPWLGVDRGGARPPAGGYSRKDLDAPTRLGRAFREGEVGPLLGGIVRYGPTYLRKRFPQVLMGAEGYGLQRVDGTKRPGYQVLKDWYARPLEWKR